MTPPDEHAVDRVFLGWDRPTLETAVERLSGADYAGALVVVPGGRAERHLEAMLVGANAHPLDPPMIGTPATAFDRLYDLRGTEPGPLQRRFVWSSVLATAGDELLDRVVKARPDGASVSAWGRTADLLDRTCCELARQGVASAEVAELTRERVLEDADRWAAIAELHQRFLGELTSRGLQDPDQRRLEAARWGTPSFGRVVLLGIAELPRVLRDGFVRAGARGARVEAWIASPQEHAAGFDGSGCAASGYWRSQGASVLSGIVDLESSCVFGGGAADQAERAVAAVASMSAGRAPEDVLICSPDETVTSAIERRAAYTAGLSVRRASGLTARATGLVRLLQAAADVIEDTNAATLGSLARHPDLSRRLSAALGARIGLILEELDEAFEKPSAWSIPDHGDSMPTRVRAALEPLLQGDAVSSCAEQARRLAEALAWVYDADEPIRGADAVGRALEDLASCGEVEVTYSAAVRLVAEAAGRIAAPTQAASSDVELVGWLEAAMDPAPCVVLCGLCEGVVPTSEAPDPLLPDTLRTELGMPVVGDRVGRDAYLLCAAAAGRSSVALIGQTISNDGGPVLPTRQLLGAGASRAPRVLEATRRIEPLRERASFSVTLGAEDAFAHAAPSGLVRSRSRDAFSVTSFRDYLASPYEFWLKRELWVQERDEPSKEMPASAFGDLIHNAMHRFGESDAKDETDPARIAAALHDFLSTEAAKAFPNPGAAVALQIEAARVRLAQVAEHEASRRADGWTIAAVEWAPKEPVAFADSTGEPASLTGRIDRIERHTSGRVAILDFKTGDSGHKPTKTHGVSAKGTGSWKDLQLPLYRVLAERAFGASDETDLAYFLVPREASDVGVFAAGWPAESLREAEQTAAQIIADVRASRFEPESKGCGYGIVGWLAQSAWEQST